MVKMPLFFYLCPVDFDPIPGVHGGMGSKHNRVPASFYDDIGFYVSR